MRSFFTTFHFASYWFLLIIVGYCCRTHEGKKELKVNAAPVVLESQTDTVNITGMSFVPAELTVTPGTTIVFINNDMVSHDITEAAGSWSSGLLLPSKSWSIVAHIPANYYCSIHAVMKGKIVVVK